jgi:hypothetical protein
LLCFAYQARLKMKGRGKVAYIPEEARGWEIDLENSEVE